MKLLLGFALGLAGFFCLLAIIPRIGMAGNIYSAADALEREL